METEFNVKHVSLVLILLGLAGAAEAAPKLEVSNKAYQEIVTQQPDGRVEKKTVPVSTVVPGTEVLYVVTVRNVGDEPAGGIVVNNPVPAEMIYRNALSAANAPNQVSVDGGQQWGSLDKLTKSGADGKSRPAENGDVTHVRWTLAYSIKPGEEGSFTYRAALR